MAPTFMSGDKRINVTNSRGFQPRLLSRVTSGINSINNKRPVMFTGRFLLISLNKSARLTGEEG